MEIREYNMRSLIVNLYGYFCFIVYVLCAFVVVILGPACLDIPYYAFLMINGTSSGSYIYFSLHCNFFPIPLLFLLCLLWLDYFLDVGRCYHYMGLFYPYYGYLIHLQSLPFGMFDLDVSLALVFGYCIAVFSCLATPLRLSFFFPFSSSLGMLHTRLGLEVRFSLGGDVRDRVIMPQIAATLCPSGGVAPTGR